MKKTVRFLLLALMLATVLSCLTLSVSASAAEDESATVEVEDFYGNEDGEFFIKTDDGQEFSFEATSTEEDEEATEGMKIEFDPARMVRSLQYMWKGMLAIFIVIGAIILVTLGMNSILGKLSEKKQNKEN